MVYTITLNPALDYVLTVDYLKSEDINRANSEAIYYGGKGINVSVILTRLGIENKALGFVAGFTGDKLEKMLVTEGVDCDFNHLSKGDTRINVKIKSNNDYEINANGPQISGKDITALLSKLDNVGTGDIVVLAGSIPSTLPNDVYQRILARLNNRGVKFVVDATGELLKNVLRYKPFLVKPNHYELGALFDVEIKGYNDVVKYAKMLQQSGAVNVLVSCGKDGAVLVDENSNVISFPNVDGKVVNCVGCGDSMVSGFIAGYLQKGDYSYALKMGSACGNATAFSAELATKEEVEKVFDIM